MKNFNQKASGFTLVEVLITVLLSLMITFAISKVLITSNQSASSSDGLSQAQETGRFVMSYLASHIREAGLDNINTNNPLPKTLPFIDCNTYSALKDSKQGNNISCSNQTTAGYAAGGSFNGGDNLAVAWVPAEQDPNLIRDCAGEGGYSANQIILNVFWIQPPTQKDPTNPASVETPGSLWCQGHAFNGSNITRSSKAQSIASGIDAMHVLYGEALSALPAGNGDRNITQYVSADNVTDWSRVYAVKVSILASALTGSGNPDTSTYRLLDSDTYVTNDNIIRQVLTTTFVVKNYK